MEALTFADSCMMNIEFVHGDKFLSSCTARSNPIRPPRHPKYAELQNNNYSIGN